jgi:hypothetical protein
MTAVLMQIKRWDNGAVLFEGQFDSMRDCVLAALKSSVSLSYANLRSADLSYANLSYAKNSELAVAVTRILPEGVLIGWKKCSGGVIVKLRIPEAAPRSHAFGRKCRAGFVEVLEVIGAEIGVTSNHGPKTEYRVGETVKPDSWDEDFTSECSHGIHFFITRAEAEAYP